MGGGGTEFTGVRSPGGVRGGSAGAVHIAEAVGGLGGEFGFVEVGDPLRLVVAVPALQRSLSGVQGGFTGAYVTGSGKGACL